MNDKEIKELANDFKIFGVQHGVHYETFDYVGFARAIEKSHSPAWRCFHCHEEFIDKASAAHHFGNSDRREPICFVDQKKYRDLQDLLVRYTSEDTDLHRELNRMESEFALACRRAEERGYSQALRDTNYQEKGNV